MSESNAGLDKDTIHAELINDYLPVAADYLHNFKYGGSQDDDTMVRRFEKIFFMFLIESIFKDIKNLRIYNTQNRLKFDITGELEVHKVWGGYEYTITAVHANKKVKLLADYTILDHIFTQHSKLELSPVHWLEYEISIVNKTQVRLVFEN